MSSLERDYQGAVQREERRIFIEVLRSHPETTLAELVKITSGKHGELMNLTVGELMRGEPAKGTGRGRGGKAAAAPRKQGAATRRTRSASTTVTSASGSRPVNTRTPQARSIFDAAVLAALQRQREPVSSGQLARQVGGTALQVRASLKRLIDAGHATWTGKARGTRYAAA